jgi:hypothetical protein
VAPGGTTDFRFVGNFGNTKKDRCIGKLEKGLEARAIVHFGTLAGISVLPSMYPQFAGWGEGLLFLFWGARHEFRIALGVIGG